LCFLATFRISPVSLEGALPRGSLLGEIDAMPKKRPSTRFVTSHHAAQHWPRRTSQPSVFTAFVRSLEGSETPDADLFHDAWHGLRAALATEMKKRGLWQSPPRYLGVSGWERWDSEEPGALGELVADGYAFIFVDRLASLKRQLAEKPDVDGLVLLNVRHFLHERQRAHDPLGFRVFELLQTAVADALVQGSLHVLGGDGRVRNDTLLGFEPDAEAPAAPLDLSTIAMRWNDELLHDLFTARSRQLSAAVERLRECLLELSGLGVPAFRFRDLLEPLKSDARRRWAALLAGGQEGPGAEEVQAPPESGVVSRQSFEYLTRCVSASIESVEATPRTRAQLSTLWQFLQRQQGGGLDGETGEGHPSYRQLGERLKIPRERLPMLFQTLRQLVTRCQAGCRAKRGAGDG